MVVMQTGNSWHIDSLYRLPCIEFTIQDITALLQTELLGRRCSIGITNVFFHAKPKKVR